MLFQCSSLEGQNASLIQTLELERQQSANTITNLEAKLREVQDALMAKVRELGLAYNAHVPVDLELDAFATLLEAEERRCADTPLPRGTWNGSKLKIEHAVQHCMQYCTQHANCTVCPPLELLRAILQAMLQG